VQSLRALARFGAGELQEGLPRSDRDPGEIHPAIVPGPFNFSPDPLWVRIVEFYCPGCGTQVETEYLPPATHHSRH